MKRPVLLAETDLLFAAGVQDAIREHGALEWAGLVRSQTALENALLTLNPGLALVGLATVVDLKALVASARSRDHKLLLLLRKQQEAPWEQLSLVDGVAFCSMSPETLRSCMETVLAGGRCTPSGPATKRISANAGERILAQLSERQVQIMTEVARGEKNAAIAARLGTTEQVVKNLLCGIYDLTGVSDRLELALYVLHHPELALGPAAS